MGNKPWELSCAEARCIASLPLHRALALAGSWLGSMLALEGMEMSAALLCSVDRCMREDCYIILRRRVLRLESLLSVVLKHWLTASKPTLQDAPATARDTSSTMLVMQPFDVRDRAMEVAPRTLVDAALMEAQDRALEVAPRAHVVASLLEAQELVAPGLPVEAAAQLDPNMEVAPSTLVEASLFEAQESVAPDLSVDAAALSLLVADRAMEVAPRTLVEASLLEALELVAPVVSVGAAAQSDRSTVVAPRALVDASMLEDQELVAPVLSVDAAAQSDRTMEVAPSTLVVASLFEAQVLVAPVFSVGAAALSLLHDDRAMEDAPRTLVEASLLETQELVAPVVSVEAAALSDRVLEVAPRSLVDAALPRIMFPSFARGDLPLDAAAFLEVVCKVDDHATNSIVLDGASACDAVSAITVANQHFGVLSSKVAPESFVDSVEASSRSRAFNDNGTFQDACVGTDRIFCLTEAELEALLTSTSERCNANAQNKIDAVVSQFDQLKEQYALITHSLGSKALVESCKVVAGASLVSPVIDNDTAVAGTTKLKKTRRGGKPQKTALTSAAPKMTAPT